MYRFKAILKLRFELLLSDFQPAEVGRQQSNCSKTGPQKIKVPPSQLDVQMCFFHIFHILFSRFFPSAFSKRISFTFFPSAFSKRIFSHVFSFFTFLWNNVKTCEKMRFENALGKNVKNMRFENVNKMWKTGNKRQLKSSCFLAPFSHVFSRYMFFKFSLKSNLTL